MSMIVQRSELLELARSLINQGVRLIPVDREKRPVWSLLPKDERGKRSWDLLVSKPTTMAHIQEWLNFDWGVGGLGAVCGTRSNGLYVFDIDEPRFFQKWLADGPTVFWETQAAYQVTGGGGYQIAVKIEGDVPGSLKLAYVPDESEETGRRIAIETKGEGGYVVLPYSIHPDGTYYKEEPIFGGSWANIPTITAEQLDELHQTAKAMCEAPKTRRQMARDDVTRAKQNMAKPKRAHQQGESVIDRFNAEFNITDILEMSGYTPVTADRWARPGSKSRNPSVHIHAADNKSVHYSTNDPLSDGKGKTPFNVFCYYEHGDDVKEAVRKAAKMLDMSKTTNGYHQHPQPWEHAPAWHNEAPPMDAPPDWHNYAPPMDAPPNWHNYAPIPIEEDHAKDMAKSKEGRQIDEAYTSPVAEFTFDELKEKITQAIGDEKVTKDDLTEMIDDWTDSAAHLKGREINRLCKLLKKGKVTGQSLQHWRADIKEVQEEIKAKKEKNKQSTSRASLDMPPIEKDHAPQIWSISPPPKARKDVDLLSFEVNDAGNADAFRALWGQYFRHVEEWGWLYYTGTHWERKGAEKRVFGKIRNVLRARVKAALKLEDEDKMKKYLTRCAPTTKNINACLTQVKNDEHLDALTSDFDNHPFLLAVANGVLDLRTCQLMRHDPTLYLTFCLATTYNPQADQSLITGFLGGLGLSPNVVSYLQQASGYTLTGSTREECLFYIFGPTRSGKGTFVSALRGLLGGTLSAEIKFSTLTGGAYDADAQNFALAPLKPCRLVVASESSRYSALNEAKIKQITGGDSIYCAFKGKTHFNYKPAFKIWLTSNHGPKADVNDDAVWRSRLKLIEFPKSFLGSEDKGLKDALMNDPEYKEALLSWAVSGAYLWFNSKRGLEPPQEVLDATKKARDQLDYVRQWLDECTQDDKGSRVTNAVLYASYKTWCDDNGVTAKKKGQFGRDMENKGYTATSWKIERKNVRGRKGLVLIL